MPSLLQFLLLRLTLRDLSPQKREKIWRKEDFPLVEEDWVRDHLGKLDSCKSMGPDGMHPRVVRELADAVAKPLSTIFERSWRTGEVPEDSRVANVTSVFKDSKKEDPRNHRPESLTSIPRKVVEQFILKVISRHVEDKKVIRSNQQVFSKGRSCLTNPVAFHDGVTGWVNGEQWMLFTSTTSRLLKLSPITCCHGFGWDRVNFLHCS